MITFDSPRLQWAYLPRASPLRRKARCNIFRLSHVLPSTVRAEETEPGFQVRWDRIGSSPARDKRSALFASSSGMRRTLIMRDWAARGYGTVRPHGDSMANIPIITTL